MMTSLFSLHIISGFSSSMFNMFAMSGTPEKLPVTGKPFTNVPLKFFMIKLFFCSIKKLVIQDYWCDFG